MSFYWICMGDPAVQPVLQPLVSHSFITTRSMLLWWVDTIRHLGVHFVRVKYMYFTWSLDYAKRSFRRKVNSIFGTIWRIASEESVLQLIKGKCLPIFSERASRSLSAVVRLSVCLSVCRLSVCNAREPYLGGWNFRRLSTALDTLAIHWHPQIILRRSSQENHSAGGVKHERGSQI